jgi:hypothetical protein
VTPVVCKLLMIESAEPRSAKKIAGHVCSVSGLFALHQETPGICECTRPEIRLQGNSHAGENIHTPSRTASAHYTILLERCFELVKTPFQLPLSRCLFVRLQEFGATFRWGNVSQRIFCAFLGRHGEFIFLCP